MGAPDVDVVAQRSLGLGGPGPWHLRFDRADATEVEVSFEPAADGTAVTIVHRGWERLGAAAEERRERNERGWAGVLERYRAACA